MQFPVFVARYSHPLFAFSSIEFSMQKCSHRYQTVSETLEKATPITKPLLICSFPGIATGILFISGYFKNRRKKIYDDSYYWQKSREKIHPVANEDDQRASCKVLNLRKAV